MPGLASETCEACRADSPRLTDAELQELRSEIPGWEVIERDGIKRLQKVYKVKNFVAALDAANRIGDAAEAEGHHPSLLVEWGQITVTWWTHKIRGLHRNDVIMAARTDQILADSH
jgi:4a-hydroxytetrahydrobiopterin dehydratase